MNRIALFALATAVVLPFTARGQTKTDFSGTWSMDASRSEQMGRGGQGGPVTLVIVQKGNDLSIETRRGENSQKASYKLDGSESVNQVMGRGGAGEAKSKLRWDGAKLVTETTREMGGNVLTTKEVRSLSADGKEMIVEITAATPQGERSLKQVFTKTTL